MTNNINPININSQAIKYAQMFPAEKKDNAAAETDKDSNKPAIEKKEVAPGDVLNYMAAQSVDVKPQVKKVVDVSQYVNSEQASRIADFVQGFEAEVEKGLKNFDLEFPNSGLSDNAKMNLAVEIFNKNNIDG